METAICGMPINYQPQEVVISLIAIEYGLSDSHAKTVLALVHKGYSIQEALATISQAEVSATTK